MWSKVSVFWNNDWTVKSTWALNFQGKIWIIIGMVVIDEKPTKKPFHPLYDEYILCLSVCLFVSNKCQNGWTDQDPNFVGPHVLPHVTPGKVYVWLNFQKFASNKIGFLVTLKIHEIFYKIREIFLFCFTMYKWNWRWARR